MSTPVKLPALGESVTEGTVTRWLKKVGDQVAMDEPLLEVSTDKVDTEIPSPVSGTLLEIKADEDETVEVGAELCVIGDEGEGGGSDDKSEDTSEESSGEAEDAEADDSQESGESEEPEEPEEPGDSAKDEQDSSDGGSDSSGGSDGSDAGGSGTPVTLPALGESVTEGTVTRWLKSVGDDVSEDEPLLEVSTDKVDTEIPSPVSGTLLEIKVEEDETVEVGAELCTIGSGKPAESKSEPEEEPDSGDKQGSDSEPEDEQEQEQEPEGEPEQEPKAEEQAEPDQDQDQDQEQEAGKPAAAQSQERASREDAGAYVTPLVRKMASEHGVDLASLEGTGVGGRIRKQDVLAAAEQAKAPASEESAPAAASTSAATPSALRGRTEKMSRLRKVIASRMVESLQTSAQLTQVIEVDVTVIARMREAAKAEFLAREGVKLTYLPFFAKAAIDALKQHPKLNANIDTDKGEVTYFDRENIAFAVDTDKGLLTPVVKEAGDLSIAGLAKKIADVAERTRTNKIGPDDLSGGTFTITNLGTFGASFDTPIINQPQVAILGPGAVTKRPVVIDDPNLGETIAIRYMVYVALTYDHRLVDGADAGRFLSDVKQRLEAAQFEV